MVLKKGKRKIEYKGNNFYWYVRKNNAGIPKIYIVSEDKKIVKEFPLFDTEVPVTPYEIRRLLSNKVYPSGHS